MLKKLPWRRRRRPRTVTFLLTQTGTDGPVQKTYRLTEGGDARFVFDFQLEGLDVSLNGSVRADIAVVNIT